MSSTDSRRDYDPAPVEGPLGIAYEAVMVTLAIVVLVLLSRPDEGWVRTVNLIVWGIFVIDYGLRLAFSGDRKAFVRNNLIDLVAIMPADLFRAARALRIVRVLRLLRASAILWRFSRTLRGIIGTNGLGWVLLVSAWIVLMSAGTIQVVEPDLGHFDDSLWWAVVTATTVGYGDLTPQSVAGRAVAIVLMVVGIGTISMMTGSIATYFTRREEGRQNPHVSHLKSLLDDWDDLTDEERRQALELMRLLVEDPEDSPASDRHERENKALP